jgi:hypothetical protein
MGEGSACRHRKGGGSEDVSRKPDHYVSSMSDLAVTTIRENAGPFAARVERTLMSAYNRSDLEVLSV